MSTINTFVIMLTEFVTELTKVFPENKNVILYKKRIEQYKDSNPNLLFNEFMESVSDVGTYIVNKNEELFELDNELINTFRFNDMWNSGISDNTKNAIWSHLNSLYIIGTSLKMIPENMMSSIEEIAKQCATNMSSNNMSNDPNDLLKGMQNMLMKDLNKLN